MLKSDNGHVVVKGTRVLFLAELTHLMSYLVETETFDKEDLETSVRTALMSNEELEEELEKRREESYKQAVELFTKALEEMLK